MKQLSWKKPLVGLLSFTLLMGSPISGFAATNGDTKVKEDVKEGEEKEKIPELEIESGAAILYDLKLKKIIYEKNADVVTPTASLAKIMTLSLASEAKKAGDVKDEDLVTISKNAWQTGGSRMFLNVGADVPFIELFKGVSVVSGNDAAVAMAEHLGGGVAEFANKMNEKAKALGMKNTNFYSPNGLPEGDLMDTSTARDLMLLANDYLVKYPENLEIHKMTEYTTDKKYSGGRDDIKQSNNNPILNEYPGADGLKTGWVEGHYNFIGTSVKDDVRLVAVVLTAPSVKSRSADVKKLLDYGFDQYSKVTVNKAGEEVQKISVYKSKDVKKTQIVIQQDIELVIHNSDFEKGELKEELKLPGHLTGNKKKGDVVGKKNIYLGKKLIAWADLVITEDLPDAGVVQKFFDSIALIGKWIQDKVF